VAVSRSCRTQSAPIRNPIAERSRVPAVYVREIDRDIADRVVSWYENGQELINPTLRRTPTDNERAALMRRREELLVALAPPPTGRHGDRCATAIAEMMRGFRSMDKFDLEPATAITAGYLQRVRDYPPWAVIEACELVGTKRAGLDPTWPPSEAAFCEVVRGIITPYRLRLQKTEALLKAQVASEELPDIRAPPAWLPGDTPLVKLSAERGRREAERRREAEQFVARYETAAPSVFELDPADWNA
jgi:hypothetical protein